MLAWRRNKYISNQVISAFWQTGTLFCGASCICDAVFWLLKISDHCDDKPDIGSPTIEVVVVPTDSWQETITCNFHNRHFSQISIFTICHFHERTSIRPAICKTSSRYLIAGQTLPLPALSTVPTTGGSFLLLVSYLAPSPTGSSAVKRKSPNDSAVNRKSTMSHLSKWKVPGSLLKHFLTPLMSGPMIGEPENKGNSWSRSLSCCRSYNWITTFNHILTLTNGMIIIKSPPAPAVWLAGWSWAGEEGCSARSQVPNFWAVLRSLRTLPTSGSASASSQILAVLRSLRTWCLSSSSPQHKSVAILRCSYPIQNLIDKTQNLLN